LLIILQAYEKFFKANDPKDGGSFYLQSKIFRAKEAILKDALDATKEPEGQGKSDSNDTPPTTPP
jgi:import inner membrane translocase subunit TIM16